MEDADLIEKIEALKMEIKRVESDLGIHIESLQSTVTEVENTIVSEILKSEHELESIESSISTKKTAIKPGTALVEEEAALPPEKQKKVEVALSLKESSKSLQEKAAQVEHINNILTQLKESITSQKPQQQEYVRKQSAVAQKPQQAIKKTYAQTQPKPVEEPHEKTNYSVDDLSTLIKMLKQLVQQNIELSDTLRELLEQNRSLKSSSRLSELTRKLAMAGING